MRIYLFSFIHFIYFLFFYFLCQLMYMARINDVMEQDNMYSVSFLKKHTDGSYYWPDKE